MNTSCWLLKIRNSIMAHCDAGKYKRCSSHHPCRLGCGLPAAYTPGKGSPPRFACRCSTTEPFKPALPGRAAPLGPSVKDREGGVLSGPSPAGMLARSLHGCIHGVSRKNSPLPGPCDNSKRQQARRLLGRDIGPGSRPQANWRQRAFKLSRKSSAFPGLRTQSTL